MNFINQVGLFIILLGGFLDIIIKYLSFFNMCERRCLKIKLFWGVFSFDNEVLGWYGYICN